MAANYTYTSLYDKVRLWLHGRIFGILGDFQSTSSNVLVVAGLPVAATRSGPNSLKFSVAGSNGAGAITTAGTKVGDSVEFVMGPTNADATSSFEATVSVAGQVQQTSASNLSGNQYVVFVQPTS